MNSKLATLLRRMSPSRPDGRFLLGAAIGTGMAAKAAERGGADFLLALNAGAFRSMGVPSPACMLAFRDCNQLVMDFGQREILTRTSLPVFFGAAAFAARDLQQLATMIDTAGFLGVANFPSCIFLDGNYRQFLEESGLGFEHEIALLQAARARGLATLAYVRTSQEARRAAEAGVDIVNIAFGWNMGGAVGATDALGLPDAIKLATECVTAVRAVEANIHCVIEGGPVVTPEQMDEVCRLARADGYIGGSTIDRVPLESAIAMATDAFKTVGSLRKQVDSLETQLNRRTTIDALIGLGDGVARARDRVVQAIETELPVLIFGETGSGRNEVARAIHSARMRGRLMVTAECKSDSADEMAVNLFGCAAGVSSRSASARTGLLEVARGSTLVLDDVSNVPLTLQRQIVQAARSGGFWPQGSTQLVPLEVRFIGISSCDPGTDSGAQRFDREFLQWLAAIRIDLPPLSERLEDLPMLAEKILRSLANGQRRQLDPSAYRALLSHPWAGNLQELRAVLQKAVLSARGRSITERDLVGILRPASTGSSRKSFTSEREWILDGLKRNRFRRAETARFLRISRKTLYNKMSHYKLLDAAPGSERQPGAE